MHKRRLREKLGKRYKAAVVGRETILAATATAGFVSAGLCRANSLLASGVHPAVRAAVLATNMIETSLLSMKTFEAVTRYRDMTATQHYRKHFNYCE